MAKGESLRALSNLASNPRAQQAILTEGLLLPLVAALQCVNEADPADDQVQSFAALTLGNLVTTTSLQVDLPAHPPIHPIHPPTVFRLWVIALVRLGLR